MKRLRPSAAASLIIGIAAACVIVAVPWAANATSFNQGRIIDDPLFDNSLTMTAVQIDSFLNQFPGSCISPNNGFSAPVPSGYTPTSGFSYGNNDTAGVVIATAAQVYGLNPQVLLSTMEKEQNLVTGNAGCSTAKISKALGYGCPDSGTSYSYSGVDLYTQNGITYTSVGPICVNSIKKVGFSQQVIHAAWLLKFGEQRSEGNIHWAVIKGNWDNSDDPESCYSGPMTAGYFQICPSGPTVYYSGVDNIDGTAVQLANGATAALYWYTPHFSGNQNFSSIYTQWFGNTILPFAFTTPGDPNIYIYVSGYKLVVPAMGVLQDYGISPQSIQTVSQATADAIPTPPSGISSNISYLVKSPSDTDSDGGSIYVFSEGKRYQVTTMQQFADFGFNTANIVYLPLGYIMSFPSGGMLSNYISTPTQSAFQVSGGQKRIIFDWPTYIGLNPSNNATPFSYFLAQQVPSGNPIVSSPTLVKYNGSDAVYLLDNGSYYGVPDFNTFSCWGLNTTLRLPTYQVAYNDYIQTIAPASSLSCLESSGGSTYWLSGNSKFTVPSGYGVTNVATANADITSLMSGLPTNANPLKQYVKANNGAAVWSLQSGARALIPTYNNFVLMGLSASQVDTLDSSAIGAVPASGIDLANGQLVKTDTSSAVYVINGASRVLYPSSLAFLAYGNSWNTIETYSQAVLDQYYPYQNVGVQTLLLYDQSSNAVYDANPGACYRFSNSQLTAYGLSQSTISANQPYTTTIFPYFNPGACQSASVYAKSPDQAVVYWVHDGQKQAFSGWNALVTQSGTSNPTIMTIDASVLNAIPNGPTI